MRQLNCQCLFHKKAKRDNSESSHGNFSDSTVKPNYASFLMLSNHLFMYLQTKLHTKSWSTAKEYLVLHKQKSTCQIPSLALQMLSRVLVAVILDLRVRSKPWTLPSVAQNKKKCISELMYTHIHYAYNITCIYTSYKVACI